MFRCLPIFLLIFFSCTKERYTSDPNLKLSTSADTLKFDTLFTSTGSTSQEFRIYNEHGENITISSIRLAGGNVSPFKINADGVSGPQINDLTIGAEDSLYVFVTVSINPTASDLPFVVQDSIEISYNGNKKWIQLQALGRNAIFLNNKIITTAETWTNAMPYVILGALQIAPGGSLQITAGTQVYLHADAPFIVNGILDIQGGAADSSRVQFGGDRLDEPYKYFPASWPGIIINSTGNNIRYANILNAYQGITVSEAASITLEEVKIDNAFEAGISAFNAQVTARNLLISNSGKNLVLAGGGQYNFTHCTIAATSTDYIIHKNPVLFLSNYINNTAQAAALNANFTNCIFWGESGGFVDKEIVTSVSPSAPFNVLFDGILWSVLANPAGVTVAGADIKNDPPLFDSLATRPRFASFRLQAGSPAINKGEPTSVNIDLDARPRPVGLPDLGCYERQ